MNHKDSTTDQPVGDGVPETGRRRNLPAKLSELRQKLNQKAKQEPSFRFYALYDRIYRLDVLMAAWDQVQHNQGAAGVDGVTIDHIVTTEGGPQQLVETLHQELKSKSYVPQAVRRVYIPKPDGRQRPLGIPTVRDRVVQTATLLILEPIFEADFLDCSYGFRPGRKAHDALEKIRHHIKAGYREVYDADLKGYFDTIPHDKLMAALRMRITDRSVLRLIRMWLTAPVVENDDTGKPQWRRPTRGTPQGGVISPLLANVYLHWFDKFFHGKDGPHHRANARLVRYADDFVVLARYQGKQITQFIEKCLEDRMGLTLNREKTRIVKLQQREALDFLGFTFRYYADLKGRGHHYLNVAPSKRAVHRERAALRERTSSRYCYKAVPHMIEELNAHLNGWANYFRFGYPRMAFREVNRYVRDRLIIHLKRRSQRPFRPPEGWTYYGHLKQLGLVYLS